MNLILNKFDGLKPKQQLAIDINGNKEQLLLNVATEEDLDNDELIVAKAEYNLLSVDDMTIAEIDSSTPDTGEYFLPNEIYDGDTLFPITECAYVYCENLNTFIPSEVIGIETSIPYLKPYLLPITDCIAVNTFKEDGQLLGKFFGLKNGKENVVDDAIISISFSSLDFLNELIAYKLKGQDKYVLAAASFDGGISSLISETTALSLANDLVSVEGDEIGFIASDYQVAREKGTDVYELYAVHYLGYPIFKNKLILKIEMTDEQITVLDNPFDFNEDQIGIAAECIMDDRLGEFKSRISSNLMDNL